MTPSDPLSRPLRSVSDEVRDKIATLVLLDLADRVVDPDTITSREEERLLGQFLVSSSALLPRLGHLRGSPFDTLQRLGRGETLSFPKPARFSPSERDAHYALVDAATEKQFPKSTPSKNRQAGWRRGCQGGKNLQELNACESPDGWAGTVSVIDDAEEEIDVVEARVMPYKEVEAHVIPLHLPYFVLRSRDDLDQLLGHGAIRALFSNAASASISGALVLLISGPTSSNTHAVIYTPSGAELSKRFLAHRAVPSANWTYATDEQAASFENHTNGYPSPLASRLSLLARTHLSALTGSGVLASLLPPSLRQHIRAPDVSSPVSVPLTRKGVINICTSKRVIEIEALHRLSKVSVDDVVDGQARASASARADDGHTYAVVVTAWTAEGAVGSHEWARENAEVGRGESWGRVRLEERKTGGGVGYHDLPVGSRFLSKDSIFLLFVLLYASRIELNKIHIAIYRTTTLEADRVEPLSSYSISRARRSSLSHAATPSPSALREAEWRAVRLVKEPLGNRGYMTLRPDSYTGNAAFITSPSPSYKQLQHPFDPSLTLASHPRTVAFLRQPEHLRLLASRHDDAAIVSALTTSGSLEVMCAPEARHLVSLLQIEGAALVAQDGGLSSNLLAASGFAAALGDVDDNVDRFRAEREAARKADAEKTGERSGDKGRDFGGRGGRGGGSGRGGGRGLSSRGNRGGGSSRGAGLGRAV